MKYLKTLKNVLSWILLNVFEVLRKLLDACYSINLEVPLWLRAGQDNYLKKCKLSRAPRTHHGPWRSDLHLSPHQSILRFFIYHLKSFKIIFGLLLIFLFDCMFPVLELGQRVTVNTLEPNFWRDLAFKVISRVIRMLNGSDILTQATYPRDKTTKCPRMTLNDLKRPKFDLIASFHLTFFLK